MKAFLVVAAVLGLTSSAAFAECAGHNVTASKEVDRTFTTASIASPPVQEDMKQAAPSAETGSAAAAETRKVTQ